MLAMSGGRVHHLPPSQGAAGTNEGLGDALMKGAIKVQSLITLL